MYDSGGNAPQDEMGRYLNHWKEGEQVLANQIEALEQFCLLNGVPMCKSNHLAYIRGIWFLNKLDWNLLARQIILCNANDHLPIYIFCKVGFNTLGFRNSCAI